MSIWTFRCGHFANELNERFKELFRDCDILFVEQTFGEEYELQKKYLNDLSFKGYSNLTPSTLPSLLFQSFLEDLESYIRNSRKKIEVERSPITFNYFAKISNIYSKGIHAFLEGNLEEACERKLKALELHAETVEKRDRALVDQLVNLQERNEEKTILVLIGVGHFLPYYLKEEGLEVRQEFPYKPYYFSLSSELDRRIRLNLPYNKEMIAQSIVESIVMEYLSEGTDSIPQNIIKQVRSIVERLGYRDVSSLSKFISRDFLRKKLYPYSTILWLREKGFNLVEI